MKLRKILIHKENAGFTLIESLITIALIAILASFLTLAGLDMSQRHSFRNERGMLISALQLARAQAINNFMAKSRGFYVSSSTKEYVIFSGDSYASSDAASHYAIPYGRSQLSGATEIVFHPLRADSSSSTINISNGLVTTTISVSSEGGIRW
jgi:prepilin-type N-terminal cleavage/methylation domain-containing protein